MEILLESAPPARTFNVYLNQALKSGWISGNEQSHKTVIDSQQKVFVERMRYVVGQHDVWRIGVLTEMDHPKSVGDRSHIAKQGFEYIMQKRHAVDEMENTRHLPPCHLSINPSVT